MKRLEYGIIDGTNCSIAMFVEEDGDYVLYDEAQAEIDELKVLADERNMISDLIMDDSTLLLDCFFNMHDAHSFWDSVKIAHYKMNKA